MVATANTTEVTNNAKATSPLPASGDAWVWMPATSNNAATITTRMPTPDSGLFDEPISPAM